MADRSSAPGGEIMLCVADGGRTRFDGCIEGDEGKCEGVRAVEDCKPCLVVVLGFRSCQ